MRTKLLVSMVFILFAFAMFGQAQAVILEEGYDCVDRCNDGIG